MAFGKSNPISVWIKWIPMNLDYIWLYYHTKPDFALFSEKFSKKMKKANRYGWLLMTCILPWIWIFKEKSYICIRIAYFQFGTLKYIDVNNKYSDFRREIQMWKNFERRIITSCMIWIGWCDPDNIFRPMPDFQRCEGEFQIFVYVVRVSYLCLT